ncbi:hypothetical protein PAPHI01_0978 [Pancytospora philotis]|nr:hypothetical protein PAPHI01_0978 [Pancytospora philotis]
MDNDKLYADVDAELLSLQDTLKDRLKETNEMADLSKDVFKTSTVLKKHTEVLEETSRQTKWKWMLQYAGWAAAGIAIVALIVIIVFKGFIKK